MTRHAHAAPLVDLGADGPAMERRRSYMVPSDRAGVEYRQMAEPGPLAGLRLDQRQYDAAAELARLWRDALPGMAMPMGYGNGGRAGERHLTPEEAAAARDAYRGYNEAVDAVQWACGLRHVIALRATVIHHEPRDAWRVREALQVLADHWRLK